MIKRHQSLALNKWVHFQYRLLVGLYSSGSCISSCDSFWEVELSYSLSISRCKRGEVQKQPFIFQENTSNHLIHGQDMWCWYNLLLIASYLPNLANTSVTAWFMAKSMSPRPRQKCGKTIKTFFNVLLNFSKDYKKQKQHNKQLKTDFFKKTQQHEWKFLCHVRGTGCSVFLQKRKQSIYQVTLRASATYNTAQTNAGMYCTR